MDCFEHDSYIKLTKMRRKQFLEAQHLDDKKNQNFIQGMQVENQQIGQLFALKNQAENHHLPPITEIQKSVNDGGHHVHQNTQFYCSSGGKQQMFEEIYASRESAEKQHDHGQGIFEKNNKDQNNAEKPNIGEYENEADSQNGSNQYWKEENGYDIAIEGDVTKMDEERRINVLQHSNEVQYQYHNSSRNMEIFVGSENLQLMEKNQKYQQEYLNYFNNVLKGTAQRCLQKLFLDNISQKDKKNKFQAKLIENIHELKYSEQKQYLIINFLNQQHKQQQFVLEKSNKQKKKKKRQLKEQKMDILDKRLQIVGYCKMLVNSYSNLSNMFMMGVVYKTAAEAYRLFYEKGSEEQQWQEGWRRNMEKSLQCFMQMKEEYCKQLEGNMGIIVDLYVLIIRYKIMHNQSDGKKSNKQKLITLMDTVHGLNILNTSSAQFPIIRSIISSLNNELKIKLAVIEGSQGHLDTSVQVIEEVIHNIHQQSKQWQNYIHNKKDHHSKIQSCVHNVFKLKLSSIYQCKAHVMILANNQQNFIKYQILAIRNIQSFQIMDNSQIMSALKELRTKKLRYLYEKLADYYGKIQNYDRSLEIYGRALKLTNTKQIKKFWKQIEDDNKIKWCGKSYGDSIDEHQIKDLLRIKRKIGTCLLKSNRIRQGEKMLANIIKMEQNIYGKISFEVGRTLRLLAHACLGQNQEQQGLKYIKQAMEIFHILGDHESSLQCRKVLRKTMNQVSILQNMTFIQDYDQQ